MSQSENPGADALAPATPRESLRYLRSLRAYPRRWWWALLVAVAIVTVAAQNLSSVIMGRSIDVFSGRSFSIFGSGPSAVTWVLIAIGALTLARMFTTELLVYMLSILTRTVSVELRQRCLSAVLRAPAPRILELGTGNVITRLTRDIDNLYRTVTMVGARLVITLVMFPLTLIATVAIHPAFLLCWVLVAVPVGLFLRRSLSELPAAVNRAAAAEAQRNNVLLDSIRGFDTIHNYGLSRWARHRMTTTSWQVINAERPADTKLPPRFSQSIWPAVFGFFTTCGASGVTRGAGSAPIGASVVTSTAGPCSAPAPATSDAFGAPPPNWHPANAIKTAATNALPIKTAVERRGAWRQFLPSPPPTR